MIKSLEISHFKRFKRLAVDGLARINVVGGRNNTGKSSLLEAIFLFHDRFDPQLLWRHLGWRGVRQLSGDGPVYSHVFHDYDLSHPVALEVHYERENLLFEMHAEPESRLRKVVLQEGKPPPSAPVAGSPQGAVRQPAVHLKYYRNRKRVNKADLVLRGASLELEFDAPAERSPVAAYVGARSQTDPAQDAERFGSLDVRGETVLVLEALQVVDPAIRSLSVVATEGGALIYADVGMPRKTPVNLLGDGDTRLLSMVLAIATARDGVVLIDEIDSGLHHSVLPAVWASLAKACELYNCQMIATTHSYGCLRAAREGLDQLIAPDFTYFRLDDEEGGGVVAKRYTYDMLDTALKQGWEVR